VSLKCTIGRFTTSGAVSLSSQGGVKKAFQRVKKVERRKVEGERAVAIIYSEERA
jgi:hypothetical protein